MPEDSLTATAHLFRAMHHEVRPLLLPNAWDAASAKVFVEAGFPAIATSSVAVADVLGYADHERTPVEEMFAAISRIVCVVGVPVTADVESGYDLPPADLADRLLVAGAVGCNLEDSDPRTGTLRDPHVHAERLSAVRDAAGSDLVVNARIDVRFDGPAPGARQRAVEAAVARGRLYREAGADCVYPIYAPRDVVPELVRHLGVPLNVRADLGDAPSDLAALGATRITYGGRLYREASRYLRALAEGVAAS